MYILFDIGGTKTRIAKTSSFEDVGEITQFETPEEFDEGVKTFCDTVRDFCGGERVEAVAGGIAGPVDSAEGKLLNSPHIPGWIEKPLGKEISENLGVKTFIRNDVEMSALGEAHYGAGKGADIVVYMTVSTGVGGARIVDGRIDKNRFGFEPGHQIINLSENGEAEGRGGQSRLEDLVSGTALARLYGKPAYEIDDEGVWEETARLLAYGVHNTILHWSPDVFVLGGSMMVGEGVVVPLDRVKHHLEANTYIFKDLPKLKLAQKGGHTGLWGSLAYLRRLEEEGIL